jgi:DnaJ-class molecular chaperone
VTGARRSPAASRYARGAVTADEEAPEAAEPVPCTVCRGTGTLISNLGGSPSTVTCAWCEGTGTYLPEHDAQAARRAAAEGANAEGGASAEGGDAPEAPAS